MHLTQVGRCCPEPGRNHCREGAVGYCSPAQRGLSKGLVGPLFPCGLGSVPPASLQHSLLSLLCVSQDPGRACCREGENELLSLLKAWQVPAEEASLPLVQSTEDLKEILCTAAAFLQGLCGGGTHASTAFTAFLSQDPLSLPLSWFLLPSKPALGVFWAVPLEEGLG